MSGHSRQRRRLKSAVGAALVVGWALAAGPLRSARGQAAPNAAPNAAPDDPCPRARSQLDLTLCADTAARRADAALNAEYRRALAATREDRRRTLRLAQRRWLDSRDAYCLYVASEYAGGSMYPMQHLFCRADVTERRAEQLRRDREQEIR